MYINFELYRVFYQVARSGSITKAAGELFISQPAVSQSIKQLETLLGGRLFLRTGRGMELTSEGKLIFDYIEQANLLIKQAENKFTEIKQLSAGEIRIGASDNATKYFLLRHVRKFLSLYPQIKVKIINDTSPGIVALLKAGKIDLGYVGYVPDDPAVNAEILEEVRQVFVAAESYNSELAMQKSKLSHADIAKEELILMPPDSVSRKTADEVFAKAGVTLSPSLELSNHDLLVEFAEAGFGVALVPYTAAAEDITRGHLFEIKTTFKMPHYPCVQVTAKDIPLTFGAKEFARLIVVNRRVAQA